MSIEFSGTLAHHLVFGHALQIVAKTNDGATSCRVSLLSEKLSKNPMADMGLNFTVYFNENAIGRNARTHGIWGEEERELPNPEEMYLPIKSGEFFTLYIFCGVDRFHISLNNREYCSFHYRLPVTVLRAIEIRDQIQVIKQVDHRMVFPSPWPPIQSSDFHKAFSSDSPVLFKPGHILLITGRCFGSRKGQFIIKFMDSDTQREELHFNVRLEKNIVVLNSMNKNLEFGEEQRYRGLPFALNEPFRLAIGFTDSEFFFGMDGTHYTSFGYRNPNIFQNLVGFKIVTKDGLDVEITGVDHKDTHDPSCSSFQDAMETM